VQRDSRAHGTPARYGYGRCRCALCRQAAAAEVRHRRRLKAYGQWQPFTDAAPVREHVRSLKAAGLGWPRIARLAEVSPSTVSSLLYGRGGRPPTTRIRTTTAEALLAVRPGLDVMAPTARVDATGTRRRLQGLVAVGWPQRRLADRLGKDPTEIGLILHGRKSRVAAATALAVRALCRDLRALPPATRSPHERAAATNARNAAAARCWLPLAWWDDDPGPHCIDDPDARPAPGWKREAGRAA